MGQQQRADWDQSRDAAGLWPARTTSCSSKQPRETYSSEREDLRQAHPSSFPSVICLHLFIPIALKLPVATTKCIKIAQFIPVYWRCYQAPQGLQGTWSRITRGSSSECPALSFLLIIENPKCSTYEKISICFGGQGLWKCNLSPAHGLSSSFKQILFF